MSKNIAATIAVTLLLASCATITKGSNNIVSINTVPSGAAVTVDGVRKTSPATFELEGKSSYLVTADKPGYEQGTDKIKGEFRSARVILGNILWLLPGAVIDLMTGSAYEMQDQKTIDLRKAAR